jgi:hypothetical protein
VIVTGPASFPEIERLSRFDGTTFSPVEPGAIRAERVYVFAHGWQPGFRLQERLLAVTEGVPILHGWDERLVDASGRSLISYYQPLLAALVERDPDAAVLWYSWTDEAATAPDIFSARLSLQATQVNGRRLASALQHAVVAGRHPRLHVIGHSHGSAVATHAAAALVRPPAQLTLLDAPEDLFSRASGAADLIELILPRLRPGREPGEVFVDSYVSAFGRPYHRRPGLGSVVDVRLVAPVTRTLDPFKAVNANHMYAVDWYARSVREAERGVGYGWSPMRGSVADELRSALRPAYRSLFANRPLDLVRDIELPAGRRSAVSARSVQGRLTVDHGRPEAAITLAAETGDYLVEFDLVFAGPAGDERIDLALDSVPAFTASRSFPVPRAGRYLLLAVAQPGQHLVTARLSGAAPGASATVTGLCVRGRPGVAANLAPERTAALLLGLGAAAGAVTGSVATLGGMLVVRAAAKALAAAARPSRSRRAR